MAEGGSDFGIDDPKLDRALDKDDDDSDQEVDTTRPFRPGAASTPYHGGEQHEMQTMQHEKSGLPDTSYEETPLLGDLLQPEERQSKVDRAIDFIKKRFPKVDLKKLGPIGFSKKGARADIVSFGPKGGETPIFKKVGSGFLKSVTDKISKSLGPSAEEIIAEDRNTIQEQRQRLVEAERQQREAEKIAAEKEKKEQEMENLEQKIDRAFQQMSALEEEHGSNLESEAEPQRLKQLKKIMKEILKTRRKKLLRL